MQKNKPLTSIIMVAYDYTQLMRNVTQLAIESMVKYTDEEDYEFILIDVIPPGSESLRWWGNDELQLGEREDRQWIKIYEKDEKDPGQYACYNKGAKMARGDYICFFQNDIFVHEGWLDNLKYYLDNKLADVVFPDQQPKTREFVKESYQGTYADATKGGCREAGMLLITKEGFERTGGWNEKMKMHYGEKIFYYALSGVGLKWVVTCKTMILHLKHGSGWDKNTMNYEKYKQDHHDSAEVLKEYEGR